MAKKPASGSRKNKNNSTSKRYSAAVPTKSNGRSSAVRNTPLPKNPTAAAASKTIPHELIAQRAYFISMSGTGGTQDENWHRAERELRRGM